VDRAPFRPIRLSGFTTRFANVKKPMGSSSGYLTKSEAYRRPENVLAWIPTGRQSNHWPWSSSDSPSGNLGTLRSKMANIRQQIRRIVRASRNKIVAVFHWMGFKFSFDLATRGFPAPKNFCLAEFTAKFSNVSPSKESVAPGVRLGGGVNPTVVLQRRFNG